MENTPTGCADDSLSILSIFRNDPRSRSVTNLLQQLDCDPHSKKTCFSPAKALLVMLSAFRTQLEPPSCHLPANHVLEDGRDLR